jgi:hypothetical protein
MFHGALTLLHGAAQTENAKLFFRASHTHLKVILLPRNLISGTAYYEREFQHTNRLQRLHVKLRDIVRANCRPRQIARLALLLGVEVLLACALTSAARAQELFPLQNVRPGLRGVGRTVFMGGKVEEFQVEILGVLGNSGPGQSIVLARLSGGPLAETGVQQGMSGSPVFIDGKLLGAVALGFPFSKEPIAGIQPIEDMIAEADGGAAGLGQPAGFEPPGMATWRFHGIRLLKGSVNQSKDETDPGVVTPFGSLSRLLIPLSFSGFGPSITEALTGEFHGLGFGALAGISADGQTRTNPPVLKMASRAAATAVVTPGSMISVGLLTGDMNITADGTVTYVKGDKVYAFGHRFLNIGSTELPFAHSEVLAVVPSVSSSFKLSTPREWVGTVLSDRATGISGEIGRSAHTVPLNVSVHSTVTGSHSYHFQVVNDRFLTPFITQAALFSVLDATERTIGRGTVQLSGEGLWEGV